ncbi:MAG TPA: TRAFs-binding domain-containing protein, partial [Paraburkholderia sp.]|nr:TRAFs-binding domain-containing protein [Paraburkholderia sp.]
KGWNEMITLVARMGKPLNATVMVQEQYGLALNRAGRGADAERVLRTLLDERGPSSETYGILGRVYKDRWSAALEEKQTALAAGLLDQAIDTYLKGFESDWRDAYPGVNAATLMELREPPDPRRKKLLSIVKYAAERRIASNAADYWDYATLLEIAVLSGDRKAADIALKGALPRVRELWEPASTLGNLRLIFDAQRRRGELPPWTENIERELTKAKEASKG